MLQILALRHQIEDVIGLFLPSGVVRQFAYHLEGEVPPQGEGVFDKWKRDLAVVVAADEEAQRIRDDLL